MLTPAPQPCSGNVFALAEPAMWHQVIQRPTQSHRQTYSINTSKLLLVNALCRIWLLLKGWTHTTPPSPLTLRPKHSPSLLLWQGFFFYLLALAACERKCLELWKLRCIVSSLETWFVFASRSAISILDRMAAVRRMKANSKRREKRWSVLPPPHESIFCVKSHKDFV